MPTIPAKAARPPLHARPRPDVEVAALARTISDRFSATLRFLAD